MVVEIKQSSYICPECKGYVILILERGEAVCEDCGLIIEERKLDIGHSGVRTYTKHDRDKRERVGSPISPLVPDISLSTIINQGEIKNPDLKRASKWNSHMDWKNKNLLLAITELKRLSCNLFLSDRVKEGAIRIYKKIMKKNVLRGRSIIGMMTACIYYSCREENYPITLQEIFEQSRISESIIKKCYRTLIGELKVKPPNLDPSILIPKYISELGLGIEAERLTIKLVKAYLEKKNALGKDPKGICAGAIYLISKLKNLKINQKDISKVTGITEVTLRSRYKEILKSINFSF
ncbi:MAG: transcription initiation factor IIB [Promethearchaeota archaeon]